MVDSRSESDNDRVIIIYDADFHRTAYRLPGCDPDKRFSIRVDDGSGTATGYATFDAALQAARERSRGDGETTHE